MNIGTILSDYLSQEQTAKELDICIRTLWLWRKLGTGPAVTKIANRIYYRRDAIVKWLQKQERATV